MSWTPSPGSFGEAELRATWELVVEMCTVIPDVDLDSLAAKAEEVGPWIAERWPALREKVGEIIAGLREDPDAPQYLLCLETLADELETHLGTGLRWPREDPPD